MTKKPKISHSGEVIGDLMCVSEAMQIATNLNIQRTSAVLQQAIDALVLEAAYLAHMASGLISRRDEMKRLEKEPEG